ncbi:hypothetical protein ACFYO0_38685 [Streptomyces sp. NPDC006365]|uniref:hypothetical protein n=1 Tax=Streptomyces sp. NPDC006365 TaxID=3364744 RepID=UPI0036797CEE
MNDAYRENVEGQGVPPVYHPQGDTAPPYSEYADPAIAHGWQNAYDETIRIELVEDAGDAGGASLPDDVGRHERLMRRRRVRMKRRGALAAGVAGVGIFAVVIAGLFGSESSGKEDREAPKSRPSSSATDEPGSTAPLADDPSGAPDDSDGSSSESSDTASGSPSPSDSRSEESDDSGEPATGTPSTTAAAPTSEPDKGNGNAGRGQGATKRPK